MRCAQIECRTSFAGGYGILLLTLLLAAACEKPPSPRPVPEHITIAFPEGIGLSGDNGANQVASSLSTEGLTFVNPDGRVVGRLAAEWRWLEGGVELLLKLRPNIVLHDGRKLDAQLAATILMDLSSQEEPRIQYPGLVDIESVTAQSEYELLFKLKRHSWWLPEDLTIPLKLGKKPSYGTGPYRVVQTSESGITLERFDNYHQGKPGIKTVTVRSESTLRTAWASLLRGDVGMVADLPPDTVELIRNESVRIISYTRSYQYMVGLSGRAAKLADPRVRQALNLAIDRAAIVANVLKGAGAPATSPIWHRHWAADPSAGSFAYAPERARELLEQAGLPMRPSSDSKLPPSRLRLMCLVPEGFIVYEHLALEVQRQLSEVGIDLRFEVQPVRTYAQRMQAGDFETAMVDLASGPGLSRSSVFWRSPTRPDVYTSFAYENPETQALYDSLRDATSDTEVRSLTRSLQEAFRRNPPAIFLAWNERARAVPGDFQIAVERDTDPLPNLWQWGTANATAERIAAR
jgi:peptide/nickel transport system substrate-binding protein